MSLTLDEVRNIKFRMAKRSGYEVLDVDEFVDQVEASFEQLLDENANLKRQVESLKATAPEPTTRPQPAVPPQQVQHRQFQQQSQDPRGSVLSEHGERIIVTTSGEASQAVVRLVQMSTEQAENLVAEAEQEAQRIKVDAERTAKQLAVDANTRAERVESEARVNAERIRSEAQHNAERLNQDTATKRRELFGELEKQRDQLASSIFELRKFESDFRQNLTNQLRGHIERLSTGRAEPGAAPAVLNELGRNWGNGQRSQGSASQNTPSDTPRLDALLGEQS